MPLRLENVYERPHSGKMHMCVCVYDRERERERLLRLLQVKRLLYKSSVRPDNIGNVLL